MSTDQIREAAADWAREGIKRGREEGRTGSLFDTLVPAFVAGAKWSALASPEPPAGHCTIANCECAPEAMEGCISWVRQPPAAAVPAGEAMAPDLFKRAADMLDDAPGWYDEHTGRARNMTRQEHEDIISMRIEANQQRRELIAELRDAASHQPPPALEAGEKKSG